MCDIDQEKLIQEINKTGFTLEYEVSKILEENDWIVNTNRYYIDDVENKPREIDIIAYKKSRADTFIKKNPDFIQNDTIYTILFISCKKESENNICCFYTKNNKKPNSKVNFITNDKFINILNKNYELSNKYLENIKNLNNNLSTNIFENENNNIVFGTQIFKEDDKKDIHTNQKNYNNKKSLSKKDDCIIYNSIETLLKSMFYEIKKFEDKKDVNKHYFINLLTILDIKNMLKIDFDALKEIKKIDNIVYNVNYIVYNKEVQSNMNFIHYKNDNFKKILKEYEKLHNCNIYFFSKIKEENYKKIFYNIGYFSTYYKLIKNELMKELEGFLINRLVDKFDIDKNDSFFDIVLINSYKNIKFSTNLEQLYKIPYSKINDNDLSKYSFDIIKFELNFCYNQNKDDIYSQENEINNFLQEKNIKEKILSIFNKYFFNYINTKTKFQIYYEYFPF